MAKNEGDARGTLLFMTHHGPMGAWGSLTYGLPGRGASIDTRRMVVDDAANMLVGVSRGKGQVRVLPFFRNRANEPGKPGTWPRWVRFAESPVRGKLK